MRIHVDRQLCSRFDRCRARLTRLRDAFPAARVPRSACVSSHAPRAVGMQPARDSPIVGQPAMGRSREHARIPKSRSRETGNRELNYFTRPAAHLA